MRRCEDVKMRRCEDEKMRYRPPLLEEPCAQTLSGMNHSAKPVKNQAVQTAPEVRNACMKWSCVPSVKFRKSICSLYWQLPIQLDSVATCHKERWGLVYSAPLPCEQTAGSALCFELQKA